MTLFVAQAAGAGRGVFTDRMVEPGETLEVAPVIAIPHGQIDDLSRTALYDYWFAWGDDDADAAVAAGFGSVYNHSFTANVTYRKHVASGTIEFIALERIDAGRQLTIDYTGGELPLWFTPSNLHGAHVDMASATARMPEVALVRGAGAERRVVATRAFAAGETIETAPVIRLAPNDAATLRHTAAGPHCVPWTDGEAVFVLGHGGQYRTAAAANALRRPLAGANALMMVAARAIAVGEEITVDARAA